MVDVRRRKWDSAELLLSGGRYRRRDRIPVSRAERGQRILLGRRRARLRDRRQCRARSAVKIGGDRLPIELPAPTKNQSAARARQKQLNIPELRYFFSIPNGIRRRSASHTR